MSFENFKKEWKTQPKKKIRTYCAIIILGFIITNCFYIFGTKSNKNRVGYKNPKIILDYSAKNKDTPELNTEAMPVLGDKGDCRLNMPLGSPDFKKFNFNTEDTMLLCHKGYASFYNSKNKTPVLVSHILNHSDFKNGNYVERESQFTPDPFIIPELLNLIANTNDYTNTHYDRGHLKPAADASYDKDLMKETFYMTNVAPQAPNLNRIIWAKLEKSIRNLVKRGMLCVPVNDKDEYNNLPKNQKCPGTNEYPMQMKYNFEQLYISTGVLYYKAEQNEPQLGAKDGSLGSFRSGVRIPNYFYKIIFEPRTGFSAAYLIPNISQVGNDSYHKYLIPLEILEKKYTKLSFFSSLENPSKFKDFYLKKDPQTNKILPTDKRNGMLDRFLF